jgi:hypothetical protein
MRACVFTLTNAASSLSVAEAATWSARPTGSSKDATDDNDDDDDDDDEDDDDDDEGGGRDDEGAAAAEGGDDDDCTALVRVELIRYKGECISLSS